MQPSLLNAFEAGVKAVAPKNAIESHLSPDNSLCTLTLCGGGAVFPLGCYECVAIIGAGKAAAVMAESLEAIVNQCRSPSGDSPFPLVFGHVVTKYGHGATREGAVSRNNGCHAVGVSEGGHPMPDQGSINGTEKVLGALRDAIVTAHSRSFGRTARVLVLVAISGGGSALFTRPRGGLTLDDLRVTTSLLLGSGAPIGDINVVRGALDSVKGGGLVREAATAAVEAISATPNSNAGLAVDMVSLILSDVIGDPIDVIASGPTIQPPETSSPDVSDCAHARAQAVLQRWGVWEQTPEAVRGYLSDSPIVPDSSAGIVQMQESNCADDLRADSDFVVGLAPRSVDAVQASQYVRVRVWNRVVGSNGAALSAASASLEGMLYKQQQQQQQKQCVVLTRSLAGDIATIAPLLAQVVRAITELRSAVVAGSLCSENDTAVLASAVIIRSSLTDAYCLFEAPDAAYSAADATGAIISAAVRGPLVLALAGEPTVSLSVPPVALSAEASVAESMQVPQNRRVFENALEGLERLNKQQPGFVVSEAPLASAGATGGRCQELALLLLLLLSHPPLPPLPPTPASTSVTAFGQRSRVRLLCAGTDGTDGPNDAAGACGSDQTIARILARDRHQSSGQGCSKSSTGRQRGRGMNLNELRRCLYEHDSHAFWRQVGELATSSCPQSLLAITPHVGSAATAEPTEVEEEGLIMTGPTGTNVMDLFLIYIN